MGAKKYQSLIPNIIQKGAGRIKEIKKAPKKVSKTYAHHKVGTPAYKHKLFDEFMRGKPFDSL